MIELTKEEVEKLFQLCKDDKIIEMQQYILTKMDEENQRNGTSGDGSRNHEISS